ncbi:MAG: hypothetical protein U9N72_00540 [Bacteroidota bacterium]|nr:hypothetical protein [Bacteroidota bacterium]
MNWTKKTPGKPRLHLQSIYEIIELKESATTWQSTVVHYERSVIAIRAY